MKVRYINLKTKNFDRVKKQQRYVEGHVFDFWPDS